MASPDRRARLRAFLAEGARLPFIWGERDCALPLGRIARGRLYRDTRPAGGGELRLYRDFFFIVRD